MPSTGGRTSRGVLLGLGPERHGGLNAAEIIKTRMGDVAAGHFGVDRESIEFRGNRVYAGNESVSFAELAQMTYDERVSLSAAGYYSTPGLHWDAKR